MRLEEAAQECRAVLDNFSRDQRESAVAKYVAVPNKVIGQVLASKSAKPSKKHSSEEASKSHIYLIHELFMKAIGEQSKPDGFAANFKHQKGRYGVSYWRYRQARLNAKRAVNNFGRRQSGPKQFATETALPSPEGGAVRLPISAVRDLSPKVIAFAAVVLLKLKPCRPKVAAAELGLVDDEAVSKLVRQAAAAGLIKRHVGARGVVHVGRLDADFRAFEHHPENPTPENPTPEKRPSQSSCKEGTPTWKEGTSPESTPPTPQRGRGASFSEDEVKGDRCSRPAHKPRRKRGGYLIGPDGRSHFDTSKFEGKVAGNIIDGQTAEYILEQARKRDERTEPDHVKRAMIDATEKFPPHLSQAAPLKKILEWCAKRARTRATCEQHFLDPDKHEEVPYPFWWREMDLGTVSEEGWEELVRAITRNIVPWPDELLGPLPGRPGCIIPDAVITRLNLIKYFPLNEAGHSVDL